jgi:HEAT repeat protein
VAAADALGGFGTGAVKPLVAALDARGDDLRSAAARSLGEIGDDRATEGLVGLLDDAGTRRAAVGALVAIHRDDATPLVRYLRSRATVAVYRPLIRIGQKDTVPALVTALERFGTEAMGETYLNCGEPRLEKAAKQWARAHGYIVVPGMGSAEEAWGGS